jgi:hypothetical protein
MDLTDQSPTYGDAVDIVYCSPCCSGCVLAVTPLEWSQFALGQLVALGTATFLVTLLVFVLSVFSVFG